MQSWLSRFNELAPIFIGFGVLFFLLQLTFLNQIHPNDFLYCLGISMLYLTNGLALLWLCFATLRAICSDSINQWIRILIWVILYAGLIGTAICDQYVILAHERLDEAFFLFSWREIWMIADPLHRFTLAMFLGLLLILGLPIILVKVARKIPLSAISLLVFLALSFLARLIPVDLKVKAISENRFVFFVKQSLYYKMQPTSNKTITIKDFKDLDRAFLGKHQFLNPKYPLLHQWEDKSLLASLLNKTSNGKMPHIKIIIVESMSSDFFGQRAENSGCLMPFLDSLAKESLYFPNAFSTYQRTHNVLPAILASVPNTFDGNVFQQLPFPRHYSLFNLLNRQYHSQFYCGVPLEYLNMIGLMSHYQVQYPVKNWNRKLQVHRDQVGNAWGFPDEDLFQQAQYDETVRFKKLQKPILRVMLTISTHDPFLYPNKPRWEQEVLQKATKITDPALRKMISSQASALGSFCYTDSVLASFFEHEKKLPHYSNTIYVITGDHGSELYRRNAISKYQVPLLFYSPLLKKPQCSQSIVSHNDIAPSILNYLRNAYDLKLPQKIPFVGEEIKISNQFKHNRSLVFTTNKLKTSDLMHYDFVWINSKAYRIDSSMALQPLNQSRKPWVQHQLIQYQAFSRYTLIQNQLIDSLEYAEWVGNNKPFQIVHSVEQKKVSLAQIMTRVGNYKVKDKRNAIRIELSGNILIKGKKQLYALPTLCVQSKRQRYLSKKWTIFRNIKPRIAGKFKRNELNKVVYSLEFTPNDLVAEKNSGAFYIYLRNEGSKALKIKNFSLKFYQQH